MEKKTEMAECALC